jgi:hypothetical protein
MFASHDLEWAHMSRGQRFKYCLSEGVISFLVVYGVLFVAFMWPESVSPGYGYKFQICMSLLGIGIVILGPVALIKLLAIRMSNARVAQSDHSIDQSWND